MTRIGYEAMLAGQQAALSQQHQVYYRVLYS
jgi:hypothetical protein